MTELQSMLVGNSVAAPPAHVLETLDETSAHRLISGAPHTIYAEVWHVAFWQRLALDWIGNLLSPYPTHNAQSFPSASQSQRESWQTLCARFLSEAHEAAALAGAHDGLERQVRCTSKPGSPLREKSVRDLLESTAAHNAYHLGRTVLLRQLLNTWPAPSGGDTW